MGHACSCRAIQQRCHSRLKLDLEYLHETIERLSSSGNSLAQAETNFFFVYNE